MSLGALLVLLAVVRTGGPKEAEASYQTLFKRIAMTQSLQMRSTLSRGGRLKETGRYKALRPNYFAHTSEILTEKSTLQEVGDGHTDWFWGPEGYIQHKAGANSVRWAPEGFEQWMSPGGSGYVFLDVSDVTLDGKPASVIRVKYKEDSPPLRLSIYVDKASGLPLGYDLTVVGDDRPPVQVRYQDVVVDQPIPRSQFVAHLPRGMKSYEETTTQALQTKLIPVGTIAPPFVAVDLGGRKVDLKAELKRHRALWINFWYCACPPCREELPALQKLSRRLKAHGLGVITINTQDQHNEILAFLHKNGLDVRVIADKIKGSPIASRYGVMACPTNYVIRADGKVTARFVGFDDLAVLRALRSLGVK